jgi:hypothetical protein
MGVSRRVYRQPRLMEPLPLRKGNRETEDHWSYELTWLTAYLDSVDQNQLVSLAV